MENQRKLALITGASSGIGLELARIFAKSEYDLVVVSENEEITSRARLLRQYDVDVFELMADLSTSEGVDEVYAMIKSLGRPLDVAVMNAGVGVGGEFIQTSFDDELSMMNLNMVYMVSLTKKILQDMVTRDEGKILFTSSIAAEMPGPYYAVYAATKSFVQSFSEAIRYEMKEGKRNITITALQPGATDTDFFARANMEETPAGEGKKDDPARVAQQGFDALMRGDDRVVAGSFMNKIQATAAKFMTDKQGAGAQARSTKPKNL